MTPTTEQVHQLCVDLRFIGKIGQDEKVHVSSKSLQQATSIMTRLSRLISMESNTVTITYLKEKIGRAVEFCDLLLTELHDSDRHDLFVMLLEDLEGCVAPDVGLEALHKTYANKHAPASEIEVIIRNVRMRLSKYRAAIAADAAH